MNNQYYDSFFSATGDVFKLLLDLEVTQSAENEAKHPLENGVHVHIGVVGDLKGSIVYHFPKETTLEIVHIMSGMDFSELDAFVTSALGEVANIISGNAMTILAEKKMVCDILPPQIVLDADQPAIVQGEVIHTTLQTSIGTLELEVALEG